MSFVANTCFDKEMEKYMVILEDYVSTTGQYRHYKTAEFDTDEEAVAYARENMDAFRVTVKVLEHLINWWN